MKILSIALLFAVSVYGQTLSAPKWNPDGTYHCAIGEVCRTPTQKEIDAPKLLGESSIEWTSIDTRPCGFTSFQYDAKTNTCWITITFSMANHEHLTCGSLQDSDDPMISQSMKCSYTPKAKP